MLDHLIVPFWSSWLLDFGGFKGQVAAVHSWPTDFCSLEVTLILDQFSKRALSAWSNFDPGCKHFNMGHTSDYRLHTCLTPFPFLEGGQGSRLESEPSTRTLTLSCHEKPKDCSTAHSSTLHDNHWVLDPNWPQRIWQKKQETLTTEWNNKSSLTNLLILSKCLLQCVLHWSAPYTTVPTINTMVMVSEPHGSCLLTL